MFKEVYGYEYDDASEDDRILIQKSTYLLECMGLDLGDFYFLLGKKGPYSLDLKNSIKEELKETESIVLSLSEYAQDIVNSVKKILEEGNGLGLNPRDCMELVCSIHFLKHNITRENENVLVDLKKIKSYFAADATNNAMLNIVSTIDKKGLYA